MNYLKSLGIKAKLIAIFVLIKVIPLVALAWFAWSQISVLVEKMGTSFEQATRESQEMSDKIVVLAAKDSIKALDEKSRENIERLAVDTAQDVARFLRERDRDIQQASTLQPSSENYAQFLNTKYEYLSRHPPLVLNQAGDQWLMPPSANSEPEIVGARNKNNETDFHYVPPSENLQRISKPLYVEMTFIDVTGQERVKITTSDSINRTLTDVSKRENTYCKAETYFSKLKQLKPGEIFVSDVIGAYQKTDLIGTYSKVRTEKAGIPFNPTQSGYAGKENPVGKRFQGIIRWVTPVVHQGRITGYVSLALNHDHIMEFTDHTIPTVQRYSTISDAGSGNYTFMWDYLGRNISHPRDYFITGYDPQTGNPALPWLEKKHYEQWLESEGTTTDFLQTLSVFDNQSLAKKPSSAQIQEGYVGLDCRYLNFAPQCDGWMNLTQHGGSGSFLIFWSGLWKLTTAAAIPYYTGQYADNPRGFGFITIGANVDEFHKAAIDTSEKIEKLGSSHLSAIDQQFQRNQAFLRETFKEITGKLTISTMLMALVVIFIAIWMASVLTRKITGIIKAIRLFQAGNLDKRLEIKTGDELDELGQTFNIMADNIKQSMFDLSAAYEESEQSNRRMVEEIGNRKKVEKKLSEHLENLEEIVASRTLKLEKEIVERKQALQNLKKAQSQLVHSEKLAGIGQLAAGIAHEINTPIQYIGDNVLFFKDAFEDIEEHQDNCDQLLQELKNMSLQSYIDHIHESRENTDIEFLKEEVPRSISQTLEGINRVADIVRSMKEFSHPGVKEKTLVDINKAITNTITVSRNEWKYSAEIETDLDPSLPEAPCLPGELNQVLLNLITNASHTIRDASRNRNGGKGTIHIKTEHLDDQIRISVQDSGAGIPAEIRDKVFDPFFTTKEVGKGTGQGLAISWSIITEQHNGAIWFETGVEGTTFFITLPVNDV